MNPEPTSAVHGRPRAVVFAFDDVPVASSLRSVIAVPEPLVGAAHYVYATAHAEHARGLASVPEPAIDELVVGDLLAVDCAVSELLRGEGLLNAQGQLTFGFHAGLSVPDAKRVLEAGGMEVLLYADFLRTQVVPQGREDALARARAVFFEHLVDAEVAARLLAFLRGETTEVPGGVLREARTNGYVPVARLFALALGPEVERWNSEVSGRLLDLWVAARGPLDTLEFDQSSPEQGVDRSSLLARALEERGVDPALAFLSEDLFWSSRGFAGAAGLPRASTLLGSALALQELHQPELAYVNPARSVGYKLLDVNSQLARQSPSVRARARGLLTSAATPKEALGARELKKALDKFGASFAPFVTRAHLESARACLERESPSFLLSLAAALEEFGQQGMLRVASEVWLEDVQLDRALLDAIREHSPHVARDVAWARLVTLIEQDPKAASCSKRELLAALGKIGKPAPAIKRRLATLCESRAKELRGLRPGLAKLAGIKVEPPPYDDSDLADLPAALIKVWRGARAKSWEAGVKLPTGATTSDLDAAEEALGAPIPEDFRSFYALHDGGDGEESFNGTELLSLSDALAARSSIRATEGAQPLADSWLPFATDHAGNYWCIATAGPTVGQIVDYDHEVGGGRIIAKSFADLVKRAEWG